MQKVPDPRSGGEVTVYESACRVTPHVQPSETGAHRVWDGTILVANESNHCLCHVLGRTLRTLHRPPMYATFFIYLFNIIKDFPTELKRSDLGDLRVLLIIQNDRT